MTSQKGQFANKRVARGRATRPTAPGQSVAGITSEALTAANADDDARALTLGTDMMFKLIALTLTCDANRSILFTFPAYLTFDWDGITHDMDTAGLANRNGKGEPGGNCWPGVLEMIAQIDGWHARKFSELVGLLDGIAEGEGTLLDQTATMWLPQFADGKVCNVNNLPIVIAGSAGGYLKQGVAVNVDGGAEHTLGTGNSEAACGPDGDGTTAPNTGSTTGNVPINKLYVTLMNALGCHADGGPVNSFGVFDGLEIEDGITNPGELTELRA